MKAVASPGHDFLKSHGSDRGVPSPRHDERRSAESGHDYADGRGLGPCPVNREHGHGPHGFTAGRLEPGEQQRNGERRHQMTLSQYKKAVLSKKQATE